MAQGETNITVVGNLVADPELRFTPSGAAVANFRIASTPRQFNRQTNQWEDQEALFLTCNVWRQAAENVAESLTKGMRVMVSGRLRQRSYETREGEKRTVFEVEVDDVGPSLTFATAQVTRTPRGGGQGGFGGNQGGNQGGQQGGFGGNQGGQQGGFGGNQGGQQGGFGGNQGGQQGGFGGNQGGQQGGFGGNQGNQQGGFGGNQGGQQGGFGGNQGGQQGGFGGNQGGQQGGFGGNQGNQQGGSPDNDPWNSAPPAGGFGGADDEPPF